REALITGDAVLLDLRTASFAVRMVSAAIDGALQLAILIGGVVALAWTAARADLDEGLIAAAVLVMSVTAYVGYPVLSELLLRGDTRSFLRRTQQTNPESRRLLSRDLVQRTLPHVAPAPPPGPDPEAFLAAVIAERSRRDEQRLRIAQGRRHELSAEVRAVPFTA